MTLRYLLTASRLALVVTLLQFCSVSQGAPPEDSARPTLGNPHGIKQSPTSPVAPDGPVPDQPVQLHVEAPNDSTPPANHQTNVITPADMLRKAQDPTDANIARIVAELLETYQYSQHPFDQEIAGRFLDRYLDSLDYSHMYFLKSDMAEFDAYRTNLQDLTVKDHDTSPCWKIFARFIERASERVNYVTNLLATEKFEFKDNERFVANRHTLPSPQDMNEARQFWREELRCEYLDQLLTSQDIQFTGPVTLDAKGGEVALTRDKLHPLSFDYLPKEFHAKNGHEFGKIESSANGTSNITVHVDLASRDNLKKTTNEIFTASGELLGDISFHHPKTETNNAAALEAVIHLNQKNLPEIYKTLTNHYVASLKNYKDLDRDRVFELYINSLARAYDPHSDYMGHAEAENFEIMMKLSLFGIGALLEQKDGYCQILELKEGPAAKDGKLKAGDRIIAVAQTNGESVDVVGMPLDKVVEMIRGPKGTQVTLTYIPSTAADSSVHKEVSLVRDEIKLEDSAAKARLYEEPKANGHGEMKLGVIDLPSFYANDDESAGAKGGSVDTTTDVARLIKRFEKEHVNGIILDLRRNGGGYLEEAIKLTGLFVPRGPVVQTKDPNGDVVTDPSHNASVLYSGPLVILTSRFSASASEILAGALQDYNRALIVGDHSTFGKGTVQTMQRLAPFMQQRRLDAAYDPGSLKVTIKKFYRAAGVSTQLKGVVSDIELPSVWNYATDDVGESALPNALPCDEVTSADPKNLNQVTPYLSQLLELSKHRIASDPDFTYIQQDIADYLKDQADKSISLNKEGRLADQKMRRDRAEARRKERLSRKKSDEKVFDLTLKNVDLAQLQPVPPKTNSIPSVTSSPFDDDSDALASDAETSAEDPAGADPTLREARHILADYSAMINKEQIVYKAP
ncbi:MAG TPA: carboxy terminal-processing peptidase [Verrucomicrobiae bacterium]|jgi:carboxyl-terminal processing protease